MKTERSGSGRSTEGPAAWIGAGFPSTIPAHRPITLLAELALLYYGNLSRNPLGLYGTTILATNLVFIAVVVASLTLIGWRTGGRLHEKEVLRVLAERGPPWMGTFAGCMAGLLIAWLSRDLVDSYLRWRIPVDEEGFAPIRVALPAFQLLFAALLCALFGVEGRGIASRSFAINKSRRPPVWGWPARLMVSLAVAAVGVEFAFDVGSGLTRPFGEFLRPLAHPQDDLRWLLVLSEAVLSSILAVPLAIGGQAVGRWLPLGCALIGLRVGMHAAELSALLVWDYYDERARSFDALSVVYMSARLGFGCLWGALLAGIGFWLGGRAGTAPASGRRLTREPSAAPRAWV
jgi:hypothetical protein